MSYYQFNEQNNLSFLNELNQKQKEAVIHCNTPQLVLAGAGSGKTRVLTFKIAYLVKIMNIPPENILAITFTNRAANEMRQRLYKLLGEEVTKSIVMGTFHSIFCKILRKNISFLEDKKYKSDFQIIDEDDMKKSIRNILEREFDKIIEKINDKKGINDKVSSALELNDLIRKICEKIRLLKNRGITYEDYYQLSDEIEKDKKMHLEYFKNIYEAYVKDCRNKNVMDFEDLLLNTFLLFKNKNNLPIL